MYIVPASSTFYYLSQSSIYVLFELGVSLEKSPKGTSPLFLPDPGNIHC